MSKEDINKDENGFFGDEKNKDAFGTPENYFESFSSKLFSKIKANEELKDYPLLAAIEKNNPFALPAGYFELREELLQYTLLRDLRQNNFTLPANYFEKLPEAVFNKIEIGKEINVYEMLASVNRENVFTLPEKYFEEFAGGIKKVVNPAKVVPLYSRILKSYKFAAAAAVLLIVTISVVLLNQTATVQPNNECTTMACLSKKEIINSNYLQNVSEENIIEMIDVKSLSDSLSLKKNGKTEKVDMDEVSENVDVNTITEEL
ncbi:MAG TPA: hypothetical protein VNZ49_06645 [Bacteroidia bacterium]|jgi:hypothetical protein|nr:hypothetical protein [Bacteroidia bacterium]